ncbi:MAG TPA: PRC-barrel domain-containing protein [Symbiobacteriaceae bacterium]|nr:PRC-barrel domain-containing protein [Symbiobacteriaceae bacterium]
MPRGSDLVGLPVLAGPELRRIGRVQEILLASDGSRVCGLTLEGGGWLQPRRVLDYLAVKAVGPTHLIAEETYLTDDVKTRCCDDLHGLPVLEAGGAEVGLADDFYFDAATGRLTALQISHGFVDDLLSGKEVLPLAGPLQTGEAAILLDGPGDSVGGALTNEVPEL